MKKITVLILFGSISFSCNQTPPKKETPIVLDSLKREELKINPQKEELIALDSLRREELKMTIISDTSQIKWISKGFTNVWIPTQRHLNITDTILVRAIKENQNKNIRKLKSACYKEYYRQYVFYVNNGSDSIVYINAICHIYPVPSIDVNERKRRPWQHRLEDVEDGGVCFWHVWINFHKRNYYNFTVNGNP
jgi:hypothetical protein